jgi:hypothetical protein
VILGELDFLYMPSRDVARDMAELVDVFGAQVIFAIDDGGTRVAMLELTESPPRILLTDHLDGDRAILVYRVDDLAAVTGDLQSRGWTPERSLEIPQGPVSSYRSAGGHRIAIYESTRPGVLGHFEGRRDF